MLSLCMTWIEVLKFSFHLWGTSSVSVPQLWRDNLLFKGFSYYFHSIHLRNEVTSGQQVLSRCFHFARLESMYWISVYTFGALLQFQYHSCEEMVYFSWDFSTTFIQCIHHNEVTSGPTGVIPMLSLCKTWIDVLKFSIHFWGTSSISVPQLWRDSLLFKGFSYYFHSMHPS